MNFSITIELNQEIKEFLRMAQSRLQDNQTLERDNSYQFQSDTESIDIALH